MPRNNDIFNYVYRITYRPDGTHYIGSRKSRGLPPNQDLGRRYFTSGWLRDLFKVAPNNFRIKIVSEHMSYAEAFAKEQKYLRRVGVPHNPKVANRAVWRKDHVDFLLCDTTKNKMRLSAQSRWSNPENRRVLSKVTSARDPATKEKFRQAKLSNPTCYWKGKQRSPETKEKIRQTLLRHHAAKF